MEARLKTTLAKNVTKIDAADMLFEVDIPGNGQDRYPRRRAALTARKLNLKLMSINNSPKDGLCNNAPGGP